MNLYIIKDVLSDYTAGMCVIAAESMPRCEQIFIKEFTDPRDSDFIKECRQEEFNEAPIKVIENVPYEKEEVVSYLYGSSGG